jgi:hypothetical protein
MDIYNNSEKALCNLGKSIEKVSKLIGQAFLSSASTTCYICGGIKLLSSGDIHYCDINLKDIDVEISEEGYVLCSFCKKVTEEQVHKISKMEMNKLPLYINHENIFVGHAVKKRLRG